MFDMNCTIAQHVAHVPLSVAAREIRRQEPGGTSQIFAVDMLVFQALVSIGAKKNTNPVAQWCIMVYHVPSFSHSNVTPKKT
jgi:hypothetical protein